jgi:hypothetical protein
MIYKFENETSTLEVEKFSNETVCFTIIDEINEDNNCLIVNLSKKDIYHLIGALHLIQKEMK